MTLQYYSYSYLCYFRNTNVSGYSFGKYVASEYFRIFIRYIMWHLNIFGYLFVSILWYSLITAIVKNDIMYKIDASKMLFLCTYHPTFAQTWNLSQAPQACLCKIWLVGLICLAKYMLFLLQFGLVCVQLLGVELTRVN